MSQCVLRTSGSGLGLSATTSRTSETFRNKRLAESTILLLPRKAGFQLVGLSPVVCPGTSMLTAVSQGKDCFEILPVCM